MLTLRSMSSQRGNVTLITAFTACLMVLLVVMAAGLSENASASNRMQAASDAAALTAATSYVSVVNDEVLLETIDWGLTFVQKMAQILEQIGNIIAAIPFLEGIGGAIAAVAEFIQSAVEDMQSVFDDVVKQPLEDILDQAKSYLGLINATIAAANNNYLGFIVPDGSLKDGIKNASPITYDLNYVKRRVAHAHQVIDVGNYNDGLPGQIDRIAVEKIWGKAPDDPNSTKPVTPPPCPPNTTCTSAAAESRLGVPADNNRDTFHFWDSTPGCTDPQWAQLGIYINPVKTPKFFEYKAGSGTWHRPCNEFYWLDHLMASYYWHEWGAIDQVYHQLFWDPKAKAFSNKTGVFVEHNPGEADQAIKLLTDTENQLVNITTGNHGDGDHGQIGRPADGPADSCDGNFQPHTWLAQAMKGCLDQYHDDACPFGAASRPKLGPYFSFRCDAGVQSTKVLDPDPANNGNPKPRCTPAGPCHVYWGMDLNKTGKTAPGSTPIFIFFQWPDFLLSSEPLKPHQANDYRAAPFRSQERGAASQAVSTWQSQLFDCASLKPEDDHAGCPTAGADSSPTTVVEEDFIEVATLQPNLPTQFAAAISGQPTPDTKYAITGSLAKVVRAKSVKDRVRVDHLCPHIFVQDNKSDPNDFDTVLGFLPSTAYGWCHVLLSSFEALMAIRNAIQSFFDPIINALDAICIPNPFGDDICLFKWAGDILQGLLDWLLGPVPPDTRTYHITLGTIGCIPQLEEASKLAKHPEELVNAVIDSKSLDSTNSGTCAPASGP